MADIRGSELDPHRNRRNSRPSPTLPEESARGWQWAPVIFLAGAIAGAWAAWWILSRPVW